VIVTELFVPQEVLCSHGFERVEVGPFHLAEDRQLDVSSTEMPHLSIIPPGYTNQ
jgi:hypothetical protein